MKVISHPLVFVMIIFSIFLSSDKAVSASTYANSIDTDTTKTNKTEYRNVDVQVKTDWGWLEKFEDVNAELKNKNRKPCKIIIMKKEDERKQCEIQILEGVNIGIFDHDSGKLLMNY